MAHLLAMFRPVFAEKVLHVVLPKSR